MPLSSSLDALFRDAVQAHCQGRLDQAEQAYYRILKRRPSHAGAMCNLGHIARTRGCLLNALELYRQASSQPDRTAETFLNLGNTWLDLGDSEKALAAYHECLTLAPNWPPALQRLGSLCLRLKRPLDARGWLEKAAALAPEDAPLQAALGDGS